MRAGDVQTESTILNTNSFFVKEKKRETKSVNGGKI